MSVTGRFISLTAITAVVTAVACGATVDPNLPAPTATLRPYTPPF